MVDSLPDASYSKPEENILNLLPPSDFCVQKTLMPEFRYVAREMTGKQIEGNLCLAANEREALGSWGRSAGSSPSPSIWWGRPNTGVDQTPPRSGPEFCVSSTLQLSDLLRAGVPLLRSLELLAARANSTPGR